MKEQEELSHFIKGQKMGSQIMLNFKKKTSNRQIHEALDETLKVYEDKLDKLLLEYQHSYNARIPEPTFFQRRAISMTKFQLMFIKTDKKLLRYILKTISMGTVGSLKYLEKIDTHNEYRITLYKDTIRDFIDTFNSFSKLLLNH